MATVIAFAPAFVLGFAAHRAGICTVKAVAEIITTGRAFMLGAFLKTSVWVLSLTFLGFAVLDVSTEFTHWPITVYSILGGLLFGVGAAVNGGCTFSTLTRLGDGDVSFGATVIGWPIGAWIENTVLASVHIAPVRIQVGSMQAAGEPMVAVASLAATMWVIWQAAIILPPILRQRSVLPILLAPQYRLSSAAALIAGCNLILYHTFGQWSFTSVILSSVAPVRFPPVSPIAWLWLDLVFALAGIVTSSVIRKSFRFVKPSAGELAAHGLAGIAMGFGAAMIPGGNDSLVLYGIASLSPHALPAYASILAGIALTFLVARRFGASVPTIYCAGDVCSTITEQAPAQDGAGPSSA